MNCLYRFGPFAIDLAERRVSQGERPVALTPKVYQTLAFLFQNRDRIVSKQELLGALWPDCHVEEGNLTQNISVLRKALGETNSGTKFIVTFPKQGYRFIGEVEEVSDPPPKRPDPVVASMPSGHWRPLWVGVALAVPLVLWAAAAFTRTTASMPELAAPHRVTYLPGREYQPVLSPDGTRLAFVSHRDLNSALSIGVLDLMKAATPQFLDTRGGDAFSPAWSPDGQRIAYLRESGGSVTVVMQELGGAPEVVTEIHPESCGLITRRLDWSPDGGFLAVSTKPGADSPFRIELIHIGEKRRTVLTTPPELSDGDLQPRFSPDGTRLAFIRARSLGVMEVMTLAIPGGDPVPVSNSKQSSGDVDWTPDSRSVLFTSGFDTCEPVLSQAFLSRSEKERRWRFPNDSPDEFLQFSVSRRTGKMAVAGGSPDQNIWRAEFSGGGVKWDRTISSTAEDWFPIYSGDGSRVAFLSNRTGDQQLWIREPDGKERQMTFGRLKPGAPTWTANGESLVFPSLRERVLYRQPSNGGTPQAIDVGSAGAHAAVSPDGASVYLSRRFYILRAPMAGGTPVKLTDKGGNPLRVSPDGNWIYYVRHRYSSEIWRVRPADGHTERLTNRLRPGCWACWSVNVDSLIYVPARQDGALRLERLDLDTRQIHDAGAIPGRQPPLGLGMLALAPDGRSVMVVIAEAGSGDVEVIDEAPWSQSRAR